MAGTSHPRFARAYMRFSEGAERRGAAEHRRRLLSGLRGSVLELGCGHGLNFPHYPAEVTEVIAVEPEPTLREAAVEAAHSATAAIRVVDGVADSIPIGDGTVDAAVTSLVLCSVPDQARALSELRRVLRPGGELRFYEHVIAERQPKRAMLALLDHSGIWPALAGGCHPARDTGTAIGRSGFTIERCERIEFASSRWEPAIPYLLGVARASDC